MMNKLDKIEARAKAATAGKWRVGWPSNGGEDTAYILRSRGSGSNSAEDWISIVSGASDDWGIPQGVLRAEDAAFIAGARTDIPLLIRAVRQLGGKVKWLDNNRHADWPFASFSLEAWDDTEIDPDVLELIEEEA